MNEIIRSEYDRNDKVGNVLTERQPVTLDLGRNLITRTYDVLYRLITQSD